MLAHLLLGASLFPAPISAVDLTKIERTIRKEPVYTTRPQYCLFVFGPEAATRVWVVLDGDKLYVDRNGNGDLTDPGEWVNRSGGFALGDLVEADGKTRHRAWSISLFGDGFRTTINAARLGRQMVAPQEHQKPRFGASPAEAPIIHFDGPLALRQYSDTVVVRRGAHRPEDEDNSLRLLFGTPGLGRGAFAACPWNCVEKRGPLTAKFDYPGHEPGTRFQMTDTLPTFS
jgi:hypothetical protein